MKYRLLGCTNIQVSELGLGCASWWGMRAFSEKEAGHLIRTAMDSGVNFFDTAHHYSGGNAEPRLGKILNGYNKDKLLISTKVGTRIGQYGKVYKDFSPAWIRESTELSLKHLGLQTIPLLHLHGPRAEELKDDVFAELLDLKERGLVQWIGINSFSPKRIRSAIASKIFDVAMMDYHVLRPEREPLIAECATANMGVIAGSPLGHMHFTPRAWQVKHVRDIWYLLRALKHHRADMKRGAQLNFLSELSTHTPAQAALAFVLANKNISCAVLGTTRLQHLQENLKAVDLPLAAETIASVRDCKFS